MGETLKPSGEEPKKDLEDLTQEEYRESLIQRKLPEQKPSESEQSQEEQKTAKLTLGGNNIEVPVMSEDQENPLELKTAPEEKPEPKRKGRVKKPPKPGPVDSEKVRKEQERVKAGKKGKSAEEYADELAGVIFNTDSKDEKLIEAPKAPGKVDKKKMEQEVKEISERQKQRKQKPEPAEPAAVIEQSVEQNPQEQLRPWAEEEKNEFDRLQQEYTKGAEFSQEIRSSITGILYNDIDEKRGEFLLKWFEENKHRKDVKERGISLDISDDRKRAIAIEMGASTELISNKKYRKEFQEIENLSALRMDFREKNIPLEIQFLMLNHLEGKANRLKSEIGSLEGAPGAEAKREAAQKELEGLFQIRKELAEKATGIPDLAKQAEEEAEKTNPLEPKEKYIEEGVQDISTEKKKKEEDLLLAEWGKLSESERKKYRKWHGITGLGDKQEQRMASEAQQFAKTITDQDYAKRANISGDFFFALLEAGFKPYEARNKGFWGFQKVFIPKREGDVVKIPIGAEFEKFSKREIERYNEGLKKEKERELGEEWDKKNQARAVEARKLVEQKIEGYASSSEEAKNEAIKGVEAVYKGIRDRLIEEYKHRTEKRKTKKSQTEQENIDQEFREKKTSGTEKTRTPFDVMKTLYQDLVMREDGPLSGLSGTIDKDIESINNYLKSNMGVRVSKEQLKGRVDPEEYYKACSNKFGLISLIFDLLVKNPWEAKKEKEKKQAKRPKKTK